MRNNTNATSELQSVVETLTQLQSIAGTNDIQSYLLNITDKNVWYILKVLMSNGYQLGLKTIQPTGISTETNEVTFSELSGLIEELNSSNVNDNLRYKVNVLLSRCTEETQNIVKQVLTKTLKLGFTSNTINKVKPNFIQDFKCMLADTIELDSLSYPVRVDLKYDGVRCLAIVRDSKAQLFTRQGKRMKFPLIEAQLVKLANGEELTFDGELEVTNSARTDISGICNSNIKSGYLDGQDLHIIFTIFDVITSAEFDARKCTTKLKQRALKLSSLFLGKNLPSVKETKFNICNSLEEVNKLTNQYIANGFEGTIIKPLDGVYEFRRSKFWIKQKAVNSCSLEVIGTTAGTNKRLGKIGALVCKSSCGKLIVNIGGGMSDIDIDLWTQKSPVGLIVEALFNTVIKGTNSDVYSLFLPRLAPIKVRIDKDVADSLEEILKQHIGKPQI